MPRASLLRLLLDQRSTFRRRVIDFNPQHWIVHKQFFCGVLCSGVAFELCFEMSIDDKRETTCRCNGGPPNISWLLFFDAEGRFSISAISGLLDKGLVSPQTERQRRLNRHKRI
jgi:hypothetical protein